MPEHVLMSEIEIITDGGRRPPLQQAHKSDMPGQCSATVGSDRELRFLLCAATRFPPNITASTLLLRSRRVAGRALPLPDQLSK